MAMNLMTDYLAINYLLKNGLRGHALEHVDRTWFCSPYSEWYDYIEEVEEDTGDVPSYELMMGQFPEFEPCDVTDSAEVLEAELSKNHSILRVQRIWHYVNQYYDEHIAPLNDNNDSRGSGWDYFDFSSIDKFVENLVEIQEETMAQSCDCDLKKHLFDWLSPDFSERISTGFDKIDDSIGGFRKGSLSLIQGSTGMGKTWCLLQVAKRSLLDRKNVLVFSDEMRKEEISKRLFSMLLSVDASYFDIQRPLEDAVEKCKDIGTIVILDTKDLKGKDKIKCIGKFIEDYDIDVVLVDGLKYLRPKKKTDDKTYIQMEDVAIELVTLSQKYQVATVCAIQSNRQAEAIGTSLGTVAGSYDMLGIAATVITLNREMQAQKEFFVFTVSKSRYSKAGYSCVYDMDWSSSCFKYVKDKKVDNAPPLRIRRGTNLMDLSDVPDAN